MMMKRIIYDYKYQTCQRLCYFIPARVSLGSSSRTLNNVLVKFGSLPISILSLLNDADGLPKKSCLGIVLKFFDGCWKFNFFDFFSRSCGGGDDQNDSAE